MICQVVINDFDIGRRMMYILDETDFEYQRNVWHATDDLLLALQTHDMFKNRTVWSSLEITHFHVMIVNMLKIMSTVSDSVRADRANPMVKRLAFFLCSLVFLIQKKSGCSIELLRVNRVASSDVMYDFNASLEVKIEPTPVHSTGLKVVIDNGNEV